MLLAQNSRKHPEKKIAKRNDEIRQLHARTL